MKLRAEWATVLRDVGKQPGIYFAAFAYVCVLGASYPMLSSWRKSHFGSLRLGERKKHRVGRVRWVKQGVKTALIFTDIRINT